MYVCSCCCQWVVGVGDQLLLMHVVVDVSVVPLMLLLVAFNRCTLAARSLAGTFTVDCQAGTLISHRYELCMCVCRFVCLPFYV